MRAVLDACVALKTILPEDNSEQAVRLRDEYIRQLHDLIAPDVFPIEFAHAITRAERRGILLPAESTQAMTDILQVLPDLHPSLTLLPRAFEISSKARIGIYDCLYLALAEQENVPLITADARLMAVKGFQMIDIAML